MKHSFIATTDCMLLHAVSVNIGGISLPALKALLKAGEIRLNGAKQLTNCMVKCGDNISIFVPAKYQPNQSIRIIFADQNIVIVDKPPYYDVENNLLSEVKKSFSSAIAVHRLDRNTSGLVVFALNQPAYQALTAAFKSRALDKYYLAKVSGNFTKSGCYTAYLKKNADNSEVQISDTPKEGYIKIITEINVLKNADSALSTPLKDEFIKKLDVSNLDLKNKIINSNEINPNLKKLNVNTLHLKKTDINESHLTSQVLDNKLNQNTSLLTVKLVTGRTHQIRAHLSHMGFPILGDGRYGDGHRSHKDGYALDAYKIVFNGLKPPLAYLNGKIFTK